MKKSDLLKLAVLGISSATMISSQVYAQNGNSSAGSFDAIGQGTSSSTNPYMDQAPATKSDGSANYTSSTSSSLQQSNGGQKPSQGSQGAHSGGSQNGSKGNGSK